MRSRAPLTAAAQHLALSTATAAPADPVSVWKRDLSRTYVALDPVVRGDRGSWTGSLTSNRTGSLQVTTEESDPVKLVRTPEAAAADGHAYLFARIQLAGPALLFQDGRSVQLDPGVLAFYDASRPFSIVLPEPQRARVLMLPRPMLRLEDTDVRRITATAVGVEPDGPAAPLLPFLRGLVEEIGPAAPHVREPLARTVAGLLSTLAAHQSGALGRSRAAGAGPATVLDRIKSSAEARLGEPELSPRMLAEELGISLRSLHKLFHAEGTTFGGWVRERRLEACRAELARPDAAGLAISAVAARWGFPRPAHFSRAFRRAYGVSPSQWRESACGRREFPGTADPVRDLVRQAA
ncbi:helix-turn-helix domain-containing protein [Streptomyces sp. NPDC006551]|uniref:helix-turn-helix domain-containing protein n=1 Tax=Streptomyces sp. NPDC006551 TaxID=3157178 RepID=UPI0033A30BAD